MSTYLITGGAGFIGSSLADSLLNKGHKVVCIDNFNDYYDPKIKERNIAGCQKNPNYSLYRADIRDEQIMEEVFSSHQVDTVIHLAAMAGVRPSIENPLLYQDVNGRGTQIVLECMKNHQVKHLVAASSSSVYGNNHSVPFREEDPVDFAISPYAATKKANEVMGHVYHSLYDINMIFLRFFTVYGPRQRPDLAIHKFTKLILEGKPLPFYGNGETSRDYTFIDDIVQGVEQSITYAESNKKVYEVMNIGESAPISLLEMVSVIEKTLNKKAVLNRLPMQPGDVDRTYACIDKAKRLLGHQPTTPFSKGIEKFVQWYLQEGETSCQK